MSNDDKNDLSRDDFEKVKEMAQQINKILDGNRIEVALEVLCMCVAAGVRSTDWDPTEAMVTFNSHVLFHIDEMNKLETEEDDDNDPSDNIH